MEVLFLGNRHHVSSFVRHVLERDKHIEHPFVVEIRLANANNLLLVLEQVLDASIVFPGSSHVFRFVDVLHQICIGQLL